MSSSSRLVSGLVTFLTLVLILLHKVTIALFCYANLVHIDLTENGKDTDSQKLPVRLDWSTFVDCSLYKMALTNQVTVCTCLVAFIELFTSHFLATPLFITFSSILVVLFPHRLVPLDPIFYSFNWNRATLLAIFAYSVISILYEKNPVKFPVEEVEEDKAEVNEVTTEAKWSPLYIPLFVSSVQLLILAKNYCLVLHLAQFDWPPPIDGPVFASLLNIRLLLLLEVSLSTSGMFVLFWSSLPCVVPFYVTLLLLDAVLYHTMLIIPERWQWAGLGYGTLAMAASLFPAYLLILIDSGTIGGKVVIKGDEKKKTKKTVHYYEDDEYEFEEEASQVSPEANFKSVMGRVFSGIVVCGCLSSHYHYCSLNSIYLTLADTDLYRVPIEPQLEATATPTKELAPSKMWLQFSPICLILAITVIEFFGCPTFSRSLFFLSVTAHLILVRAFEWPLLLDPILANFTIYSPGLLLLSLAVSLYVLYALYGRAPRIIPEEFLIFDVTLNEEEDLSLIRRMCQAIVAVALNQANAQMFAHLQYLTDHQVVSGSIIMEAFPRVAFSKYLVIVSGIVGLYGELLALSSCKLVYGALVLFTVAFYPTIVVAPTEGTWTGLPIGFSLLFLAAIATLTYGWLCLINIEEEEEEEEEEYEDEREYSRFQRRRRLR